MLTGSLSAEPVDDAVRFTLAVENDGEEAVTLSFRDSMRADFAVRAGDDDGGTEVWRWSEGRMFAQMLGTETVGAGETVTFEGTWDDPEPGEYVAVADLAANDADVSAEAEFSV
ncbi:BsuPI-related putative proteinase inhibitor [Halobium salinum]|uniref:Intracellular proteinase inhibitor BsuPI domain-containing protein n=1 Tax=Halobium salinum TaxID=1364940 RepID=A0ABD5P850_9EURY|nr:BsuPI-related putative proteinase inhibitor [Halobium salinum]